MESPAQGIQSQTQGNETPAQGNESQAQGNENRESCDFNRLRQILISGAPLTLTFCGSRSLKGASPVMRRQYHRILIYGSKTSTQSSRVGITLGCTPWSPTCCVAPLASDSLVSVTTSPALARRTAGSSRTSGRVLTHRLAASLSCNGRRAPSPDRDNPAGRAASSSG